MLNNSLSPLCEKEPPAQYPWLSSSCHCEAVVVGGTITGCAIAASLSKNGIDTVLLSAQPIGNESACAIPATFLSGFLRLGILSKKTNMETAIAAFRDFALAADQLEKEASENGIPFARRDILICSDDDKDDRIIEEEYRLRKHNGLKTVLLDSDILREKSSFSAQRAVFLPNGSTAVDPVRMSQHYAACAKQNGARIYEQTEIQDIHQEKGRYRIETSTGRYISAKFLILTQPFLVDLENDSRIRRRFYASASTPCSDFSGYGSKASVFSLNHPFHFCTSEDDRVIAFCTENALFSKSPRQTHRFELLESRCHEMLCGTRPVFPDRRASQLYHATKDGLPTIGPILESGQAGRLLISLPSSPDELTTALLSAPLITALCSGKHPYNPYSPDRF